MALRDDIKQILARKLFRKLTKELTWGTITSAVSSASPAQKGDIVAALKDAQSGRAGSLLSDIVSVALVTAAELEAESLLSDDQLTLTELARVFGDS